MTTHFSCHPPSGEYAIVEIYHNNQLTFACAAHALLFSFVSEQTVWQVAAVQVQNFFKFWKWVLVNRQNGTGRFQVMNLEVLPKSQLRFTM